MKIYLPYFLLMSFTLIIFTMNQLKGQQKESSHSKKDEIEVILAPYFFDTDAKTIEIIESKEHITCDEYIDLTLAYANLFADTSKIDSLVALSISTNNHSACEFWSYLLKDPKKHQITYQYYDVIKTRARGCDDE